MTQDPLDLLVAEAAWRPDWQDVLDRAGALLERPDRSSRRHRRRSLVLLALVLIALVLLLLATPAFGLRGALLDVLGRNDVDFDQARAAPTVIKQQFNDLDIGAPAGMAANPLGMQARLVGTFVIGGRASALYVVPAKNGGFCYAYVHGPGGCQRTTRGFLPPITTTESGKPAADGSIAISNISGTVLTSDITSLAIEYGDGTVEAVPFTYVSGPIDAGFYTHTIPVARQRQVTGPRAVIGRDGSGEEVWREEIRWPLPR